MLWALRRYGNLVPVCGKSSECGTRPRDRAGGAGASIDGIIAAHGRLKSDFALAESWLTRYVETGNVPPDDGSTRGGVMACGVVGDER
jgi:hypothetical protein